MAKIKNAYRFVRYVLLQRHFYGITAPLRVLPDFAVIGVGRGGTTSLYHYLDEHPCITKSAYDELGFFDDNYHLGLNWYRSMFPTKSHKEKIIKKFGKFLTYDVTPFYIYNKISVERIFKSFPNSKIIAVLRNPIDRAYSNYFLGDQKESFEKTVEREKEKLKRISAMDHEDYYKFIRNSLLARGFYAEQLKSWFKVFPKEKILIIKSEDLSSNPQKNLNEIFQFLELPQHNIEKLEKKNLGNYLRMEEKTRNDLTEFFRPYNEKLYLMLGRDFGWDK